MRNNHIVSLLEEQSVAALGAPELELIRTHTALCADCRLAYESARISAELLRERASFVFEPPPFFETRVLAAVREQRQESESFGLWKIWSTARGLIVSMAVVVALLTGLTLGSGWSGQSDPDKHEAMTAFQGDPSDLMIYGKDGLADDDLTDGQLIMDLYDDPREGADAK
jgi:hypothetical protein